MLAIDRVQELVSDIGRAGLSSLFPNDFEYYFMALELVNSQDEVIDYFAFPVIPDIRQEESKILTTTQTDGGLTILSSSTLFVPISITLNGDFGRKFRILFRGGEALTFSALRFTGVRTKEDLVQNLVSLRKAVFDPSVKTGYGCIKILQSICDKSDGLDDLGKPFRLNLYNMALGEAYWVKVNRLILTQEKTKNMIWSFNLQLTAIARLEHIIGDYKDSVLKRLGLGILQKEVNVLAGKVYQSLVQDPVQNRSKDRARSLSESYSNRSSNNGKGVVRR